VAVPDGPGAEEGQEAEFLRSPRPDDDVVFVDTLEALRPAAELLLASPVVGLDCEWAPSFSKSCGPSRVSILQVANSTGAYVFDLIALHAEQGVEVRRARVSAQLHRLGLPGCPAACAAVPTLPAPTLLLLLLVTVLPSAALLPVRPAAGKLNALALLRHPALCAQVPVCLAALCERRSVDLVVCALRCSSRRSSCSCCLVCRLPAPPARLC